MHCLSILSSLLLVAPFFTACSSLSKTTLNIFDLSVSRDKP